MRRNLLTIGTASVALLSAVQSMAADSTVTYDIQPTCGITGLNNIFFPFPDLAFANANNVGDTFTVICDDPNGATFSLTTANGGLQNSDDASIVVNYTASVSGFDQSIELTTDGTPSGTATQALAASADLANPSNNDNAFLLVNHDTITFSGTYTDTLSINITGNP